MDTKASVVLVVETAVAGAAARALITSKGYLHATTGLQLANAIVAVVLLALGVACALWVVFPRLERRRTRKQSATGMIYFGHLRRRTPEDIEGALARMNPDEERRQLAAQLHITGDVAWRKHAWLQRSLSLFAIGAALIAVAYVAY